MTSARDDLIERLAREAGISVHRDGSMYTPGAQADQRELLCRLVELVVEEAARVCDAEARRQYLMTCHDHSEVAQASENCAAAVRAMFKEPTNAG